MALAAGLPTVSATQLPGHGLVLTTGASAGLSIASSTNTGTLTVTAATTATATPVIIQWGGNSGGSKINSAGTAGFNIGGSATLDIVSGASAPSTLLNIDNTGNPSQILGNLSASGVGAVFVANANGIVVGSSAVITAPNGLGLINADETSSKAQAIFQSNGDVPVSFIGATGGVTINAGADLYGVGTELLVAGAGNVNVAGAFVSNATTTQYAINDSTATVIDGGVGGYFTGAAFSTADSSAATPFASFSANAANNFYQDSAGTTVALNLGTTTSPYSATKLSVLADGNINLASGADLTTVTQTTATWANGTFTNNGVLDYGTQTGSSLVPTTTVAVLGIASTGIYNNTTTGTVVTQAGLNGNPATTYTNPAGAFINGSSGMINAGGLLFIGDAFTNDGTLQLGQVTGGAPSIGIVAVNGGITLAGTTSVVGAGGAGTPAYTGSAYLSTVLLDAAFVPGQTVSIDTNPLMVSGGALAAVMATNVTLASSLTVTGGSFDFIPFAAATPVSGSFTVNSGATLSADSMSLGAAVETAAPASGKAPYTAFTSYNIGGSVIATGGGNPANAMITMGLLKTIATKTSATAIANAAASPQAAVYNVSGAGSITAGALAINNLQGSVNNITTGQILANGFQLKAAGGKTGTMALKVTADGAASQGFNVKVDGNATINSGGTLAVDTQAPANNQTYRQYLYPANANSNMVVQASGNLTVNAGTSTYASSSLPGNFFQWPGLVYLQANGGSLTSTTAIANAYAAQATTGHAGVFLVANNITDNSPIYTNGNAGVVFAAPFSTSLSYYPYAKTINGVNPSTTNPGMPTVYFATPNKTVANANYSFQVLSSFTNENGYKQENQTFLRTFPN
jgi:filamentous hemagglutinin family protein